MVLARNDLDDTRSTADSEDAAPNASDTDEEVFVPKEPEDSAWPEEWPKEWPKPKFSELELKLTEFKKAHKNVLPSEAELPGLVFADKDTCNEHMKASSDTQLLYKLLLGTRNADGKLDQSGQKDSMRTKWKSQFPKSKRSPDSTGFKLFSDESYMEVEAVLLPALATYVSALEDKAKGIDKGHQPTALLKQAQEQLKRANEARDARKKRVEEAQKKRRAAELAKKRARPSKPKASNEAEPAKLSDADKSELRRRYFDLVKQLSETTNPETSRNYTMEEAFVEAEAQHQAWEAEAKGIKGAKA